MLSPGFVGNERVPLDAAGSSEEDPAQLCTLGQHMVSKQLDSVCRTAQTDPRLRGGYTVTDSYHIQLDYHRYSDILSHIYQV